MVKVWQARETTVKIDASSDVTIDDSSTLDSAMSGATAITAKLKNVTIVEPEGSVDALHLLGQDANGFQNMELDQKPFGLAQISGTLVHESAKPASGDSLELLAYGSGTAVPSGSPTHTRWQPGDGNRSAVTFLVTLDDGTYQVNIMLHNALVTKLGDRRISGADGHWEQDFTAVCKPSDFYVEMKDAS